MTVSSTSARLTDLCQERRTRIRAAFDSGESATATLRALCEFADEALTEAFHQLAGSSPPSGVALIAIGGYGRRLLFPYSDLDVLFLFENETAEKATRTLVAELSRTLWDAGFRVSFAGRTIEESKRVEDDNAEFHLALLDRRFLIGNRELHELLDRRILQSVERKARPFLMSRLAELTQERHARYGNTIFHLEPNVKEAPGGLRDYQAAHWLQVIAGDPDTGGTRMTQPVEVQASAEFISAVRCFLHYANGRNDNSLTYELQAQAAARSLGMKDIVRSDPADWMRIYFRHARALNRQLLSRLEIITTKRSRFGRGFAALSKQEKKPFFADGGKLELEHPEALKSRDEVLELLIHAAETGIPLSRRAESAVLGAWLHGSSTTHGTELWPKLRMILGAPYPAVALRPMHRLGILARVLPEFHVIDALVVRDFYHRYTVDEHSLRTVEHLQELAAPPDARGIQFSELWKIVNRRDLLILALLLHDVGKGMTDDDHVVGSVKAIEAAAARLELEAKETQEVHFLIERHLAMSAALQRRDIFDPATISAFADLVETQERLDRLCLLTYADIHAVNAEALTPWKAEMLWQLFAATSNHLSRSLDSDRLHAGRKIPHLEEIRWPKDARKSEIDGFLEGFPRRYLAVHSPAEIATHFLLYRKLGRDPLQIDIQPKQQAFALTLLTPDRPALFSTIAGVLAGWGMNIVKADAFANAAGVALDTFYFGDLHRTLELNPGEVERFRRSLVEIISGKASLKPLLEGRLSAHRTRKPKITVKTSIRFDDNSSSHCTLLEILAQDRPGLLYEMSSALADLACNIDVALIDTEGQKVIDVFYLTKNGKKLSAEMQERVAAELARRV
jgi:[protein-PII] uridylyltransferase